MNSRRFIDAYNRLDGEIRNIFKISQRISYSDAIRKSSFISPTVRKYQDELISYGRLRNAIVHESTKEMIIAEPNLKVVEHFEHIVDLILTPPKINQVNLKQHVLSLNAEDNLKHATKLMFKSGYSNLPILENGKIIGIINNKKIVSALGANLENDSLESFFSKKVNELVRSDDLGKYYEVVNHNTRVDEIIHLFEANPRLSIVLVEKNGEVCQTVAPVDVIKLARLIEDY